MRAVLQRVSTASVTIEGNIHSSIATGLVVLLGITHEDTDEDIAYLIRKICGMRIFSDEDGLMNLSVNDIGGELLVISQFTLYANTRKGNRPSFVEAAKPDLAIPLYEKFLNDISTHVSTPVKSGVFGADMQITLVNDGPVTIVLDSRSRK